MNQAQNQIDFITVITVGSTKFENLINQTINKHFINSIHSVTHTILSTRIRANSYINNKRNDSEKTITKSRLIIQIGRSNLNFDQEILRNFKLIETQQDQKQSYYHGVCKAIDDFNSGLTAHLNLAYSPRQLSDCDDQVKDKDNNHHHQTEVLIFRFTNLIDSLLSIANLIISHAGAGSILASIKPNQFLLENVQLQSSMQLTKDYQLIINKSDQIKNFKHLIIVPNQILMDNHQVDLANEISNLGLASTCEPHELIETIQKLQSNLNINSSSNNHQIISNPIKFKNFLDLQVGFSKNLD